jgi:hypothetical protein
MLPIAIGIAIAGIAWMEGQTTDAKIDKEVEKFQKGKQSREQTKKNIDKHVVDSYELDDYLCGETDSNLVRQQLAYEKAVKLNQKQRERLKDMNNREKELFYREQVIKAHNRGEISYQDMDKSLQNIREHLR